MSYGFYFNGVHSSAFGIIMRSRNRQALPLGNDHYNQIPGREGSYLFARELSDRYITISCVLIEASLTALRLKTRQIAAWLYTIERVQLVFDDELDRYYIAKLDGAIDLEQVVATGKFDLRFRCEPLAYGGEQEVFFSADSAVVNNAGTYEAMPLFRLKSIATASEIKIILGSKYIRIVREFEIDDELEINCSTGAVLINGYRAMADLDWQNSEFITLPVGEIVLTVLPAGVYKGTVSWKPRWL